LFLSSSLFWGLTHEQSTSFSLCGADVVATLNGNKITSWSSLQAKASDVLEIGYPKKG